MFDAPLIFTNIPDIKQMYEINERQCEALDAAVDRMDNNIFLDDMDIETIARWEQMLELVPLSTDTEGDRRFKVKTRLLEKLPYSYRVIVNRLETLCPYGYEITINEDRTSILLKLAIKNKNMLNDAKKFLERILPLNMTYDADLLYTQYYKLEEYTYGQLGAYAHYQIRELA